MFRAILASVLLFTACSGEKDSTPPTTAKPSSMPAPPPSAPHLTLEDVAAFPRPGTVTPESMQFAEEGKQLTFLFSKDQSLSTELYALDVASGQRRLVYGAASGGNTEDNLSPEEKLERERRRERGTGVTRYAWSKRGEVLLLPVNGELMVQQGLDGELRTLVKSEGKPALSPKLSPDGKALAYVRDDELYVVGTDTGEAKQLTTGARGTGKVNGLAEYIAQEEMGRSEGFWWSDDGKRIAFCEVDETTLPAYRIMHQGQAATDGSAQEDHGYPFAGKANARVRLGVVPVSGGKTSWMDLGQSDDIYLARVHWMPSGELWAEIEDRAQSKLSLVRFDAQSGARELVLSEESEVWINLHSSFRALRTSTGEAEGGFVWASERTGYMHLYLYNARGELLRPLTAGEWPVDRVVGVDEKAGAVYFVSGMGDPRQSQLYQVSLQGGEPRQISTAPGTHSVVFDSDYKYFVDTHSSISLAPTVTLRSLPDGALVQTIHDEVAPPVSALELTPPEMVRLESRDGVELFGAIYQPPASFKAPYPTVVSVYGGPHAQRVADDWSLNVDMRAQYLRERGYLVFKLDNRGSARRGLAFEGAIKNDMGHVEIEDQVDGVNYLVERGLTDPKRVAVMGWSYGGYLSAMALARAPETFAAAIAGAPVTHWDGYDTHYTERYMGTPESNPKGYLESSVMHHLEGMKGKLMIVHGLIDENVHFRHSARLIDALIKARKHYELLLFPNERHMPRSEADRVYMEERMETFLEESLERL